MTDSVDGEQPVKPLQGWRKHGAALLLAMQFLTTLPIKSVPDYSKPVMGLSLLYYPVVGLLLGMLLWALAGVSMQLFSPLLSAVVVVSGWVLLTGALHIDGLADCADAWVGGLGDRERTLTLMKDPVSGPVAVAVVALLLLLKVAAVYELLSRFGGLWLLWIPVLGRAVSLLVFLTTPYIRKRGLGEVLAETFSRSRALILLSLIGTALILFAPQVGLSVLVLGGLVFMGLRRLMLQRLGGSTGDTIGAAIEILEVVSLLAIIIGLTV